MIALARRLCPARAFLLLAALAVGGCGSDAPSGGRAATESREPAGGNGLLVYALPSATAEVDPLLAKTEGARIVSRQIYEPLVETLSGPYGEAGRSPGLALSWKPSRDRTIWSVRLRRGVRFQDGSPFNANAVLANATRWTSVPAGRAALPGLTGADAPRPDLVRFILRAPTPDFPRRLSQPQLGIVAPAALRPRNGEGARLTAGGEGGCGPFAFLDRGGAQLELTRNEAWWGSSLGLGPALDGVSFAVVPSQRQRVGLLRDGEAQAAGDLGETAARGLARDPLLSVLPTGGGRYLGLERSVRGMQPGAEPLSGVWLTRIGRR